MKCPICSVDLVMSDRQGVEIDYCPKCRGVWLDRGELDKIVERSAEAGRPRTAPPSDGSLEQPVEDDDSADGNRKKERRSWLGDLFD
jgi:uncharacterized protein